MTTATRTTDGEKIWGGLINSKTSTYIMVIPKKFVNSFQIFSSIVKVLKSSIYFKKWDEQAVYVSTIWKDKNNKNEYQNMDRHKSIATKNTSQIFQAPV